jgi:hypothetical protein
MNTVQALAVAAAALAVSGDPLGVNLAAAEAQLVKLAVHGEAVTQRIAARATAALTPHARCAAWKRGRYAHALPDTSIHTASRAARL